MCRRLYCIVIIVFLAGCQQTPPAFHHANASGYYAPDIISCVPYARDKSRIAIYGDADTWWQQAAGRYRRGQTPAIGAVLVLKKTPRMRSGHVAVVTGLIDARRINVTHSNWGSSRMARRIIYTSMLVQDVSPGNDWSKVSFWNDADAVAGFPYEAYGFIYP